MSRSPQFDHGGSALAVATHALSVRYGRTTALHDLDLRVPDGAVYVLIGANGAGKSTAMKSLLNLERPVGGRAEVFGLDTASDGARVRAQIGYVPDAREHNYHWMTAGRLVQHAAAHYPTWDAAYAARLSEAFGVLLERRLRTLSRGEMRRLQLVLALAHRPPLLLLDEPTDGLDPVVRNQTLARLAEHLADSPTTVLMSTHHAHEIESLADHVGVLREGRLVAQMSRDELRRTVLRYRAEVPEGWEAPPELRTASLRRSPSGRELQWTLVGEESDVIVRLAAAGAVVREVTPLSLEEAALAFLSGEGSASWK